MNNIYYVFTIILFSGGLLMSCNKSSDQCDENKVCYTQKPDSLYIELQLSKSPSDQPVEVNFYIGNSDDGDLYHSFLTNNTTEYFLMPVNKKYSAEAVYVDDEITTVAVDGDRLEAESYVNCDQTCYEWEDDLIFDLMLKE